MKRSISIVWGIVLIIVGVLFFGNSVDLWNVDIFFKGWWTLFIIIPSLYGFYKKEWISSAMGVSIGALLFLATNDYISWNTVGSAFLPLVIIAVGLSFIFKPQIKNVNLNKKGLPEYVGVFSGNEQKIKDKFEGASCVAVFGGVELDLTSAVIKDDIVIDAVSVFGGIDLKVPDNVKVVLSGVPIFGGAESKAKQEDGPTIYINYVCIFGGVEVK